MTWNSVKFTYLKLSNYLRFFFWMQKHILHNFYYYFSIYFLFPLLLSSVVFFCFIFNHKYALEWDKIRLTLEQRFPTWATRIPRGTPYFHLHHEMLLNTSSQHTKRYARFLFSLLGYASRKRLGTAALEQTSMMFAAAISRKKVALLTIL